MITIANTIEEVSHQKGVIRAGGTDLQERLRSHVTDADVVDITRIAGLDKIERASDGSVRIGALTKVAAVGRDEMIQNTYPVLALPAQILANPQTREMATMGGVLCQRNRCWYYRHPEFSCYKKGGNTCPAREGVHSLGVIIDKGPCVFPHPTSVGLGLLTYDTEIEVTGRGRIPLAALYGDGTDPSSDNTLNSGEMLTHIHLPPNASKDKVAYLRMMTRTWAEWPIIEIAIRLIMDGDRIRDARVAVNAVANIPMRMPNVEAVLAGNPVTDETLRAAADASLEGLSPLPQTEYKVELLRASMYQALLNAKDNQGQGELVV